MADGHQDLTDDADRLDQLAAEVDDPRRAAALAEAATALRELTTDDDRDRDSV